MKRRQLFGVGVLLTTLPLLGCGGGSGTTALGLSNDAFTQVTRVTNPGGFFRPLSAVPDASNTYIYFVASSAQGAGVFRVPASGGDATPVMVGTPFVAPNDLVLSTDNQTLYVADPIADAVYTLPISGGTPTPIPGTVGKAPVALDVIQKAGQDTLYLTGKDPADSQPALYELPAAGSPTPTQRYKGAPLVAPTGITSASDGTLYIADRGGKPKQGAAYRLTGSAIQAVVTGIQLGEPGGIALTPDSKTLAVSSLDTTEGTAQVYLKDLSTGAAALFNKTIGENSHAGGLHAARNASGPTSSFGWADFEGRVYRLYGK